jgi:two-component system cell cycle sensor histidine kinase PleC
LGQSSGSGNRPEGGKIRAFGRREDTEVTNHDPHCAGRLADPAPTDSAKASPSAAIGGPDLGISPDPLLCLQPDGTIIEANQRAAEMFNCHGRLIVGAHVGAFLEGLKEGDSPPSIPNLLDALCVADGRPIETVAHRLNGGSIPVEITTVAITCNGAPAIVAAIRDITHRKQSEHVLTRAKERAERANVAKLDFLGQLSHELRTPLATIIGFGEVMRDEMFGPIGVRLYKTYAADICRSGRQLTDVVERIIDVTRLEGRIATAHTRTADLAEIVDRVLANHAADAAVQGIRLSHNLRRGSIPVVLDDETLEKMIGYVVESAIQYNRFGGRVEIDGHIRQDHEGEAPRVVLTVKDNGQGLPGDKLDLVRNAIDTPQDQANGLSLCAAFLHLIGGSLTIESSPNVGTLATLVFPQRHDGRWRP